MQLPDFILALPELDIPVSRETVESHGFQGAEGLVAFFLFREDFHLPPHAHGAQWGTVLHGEMEVTIAGKAAMHRAGDSYDIPAGMEHSVRAKAGTIVVDFWEERDRYGLRSR